MCTTSRFPGPDLVLTTLMRESTINEVVETGARHAWCQRGVHGGGGLPAGAVRTGRQVIRRAQCGQVVRGEHEPHSYRGAWEHYAAQYVLADDAGALLDAVRAEKVADELQDVLEYTVDFRVRLEDGVYFHQAKFVPVDGEDDLFIDTVEVANEDVVCDKLRLNQVLLNLLSNAMKFTEPGGAVSLRIRQTKVYTRGYAGFEFRVKDTGIGMSEEFQAHIFEAFERERNSTVSGIQGTGLGIAITKSIVGASKPIILTACDWTAIEERRARRV